MNKICTNPKNYKLTQGKVYEILDEEDGYYLLINDSNKTVRYYSDLFDDAEEAIEEVAPPPPPARTEVDVISSLTVAYAGSRQCRVIYQDLNNNTVDFTTRQISVSDTNISCGVRQLYNINDFLEGIDGAVTTEEDDLLELKKQIVKKALVILIEATQASSRWMLMSTNYFNDYEDYYEVFDSLAQTNLGWEENPNSGNDIKLWVFNSANF
jgi:hypothetical protein